MARFSRFSSRNLRIVLEPIIALSPYPKVSNAPRKRLANIAPARGRHPKRSQSNLQLPGEVVIRKKCGPCAIRISQLRLFFNKAAVAVQDC
jgi:hypothetical protein